ncbi:MAG: hypothetical protein U0L55_05970, partial [Acutalibacteraceae bacterium]|nr:hypothetical protein [Acutalibacteraceae bacterium]
SIAKVTLFNAKTVLRLNIFNKFWQWESKKVFSISVKDLNIHKSIFKNKFKKIIIFLLIMNINNVKMVVC